jgi:hypothetical protein
MFVPRLPVWIGSADVRLVGVSLIGARLAAVTLFLVLTAGISLAAGDRDLRITVYNNDLGLVSDQRILQVPNGQGTVEISDVPAQIDPTSVHLKPLKGSAEVLEQNFQYDLANPDRILQRYLDQPVEAVVKEGSLKSGDLLSFDGTSLVLRGADGGVSLVTREQIVDLRFPKLPEGLRTRPTLVWLLQSREGGPTPVELSYLTGGLNWHAEYVAVSNETDTSMDLSAWISLENNSGAGYPEAELQLIAGDVQRVQDQPVYMQRAGRNEMLAAAPMSKGFEEESFFEYHLYTLDRRTTIADRETKQVSLFPTATAPVKKLYEYNGQRDAKKVRVVLEAQNRKELGLGMPLPAGKVRVYKKDSHGNLQFVGEDKIDHTPKDEKIRLGVGKAFDVVAERKELSVDQVSERVQDRTIEVTVRNHKTEQVQVVVQENLYGDWKILSSSLPGVKKDASTAEFRLDIPPNKEVVLTFKVRSRF